MARGRRQYKLLDSVKYLFDNINYMDDPRPVALVRDFNRFYTQQIGVLQEGLLDSPFSLTEVRILYELAHRTEASASEIGKQLGLDPGYLSRILRSFEKRRLIRKKRADSDRRLYILTLSKRGMQTFASLNTRSDDQMSKMLSKIPPADQRKLLDSMQTIKNILGGRPEQNATYILRNHQPGDMGWVVHRHGVLYSQEYGWDEHFEALVARIVSDFIEHFDPKKERCWMAEHNGEIVGSVFLVKKTNTIAKLRLLLVEPNARGLGIGSRLVNECERFARQAGYRKIVLWTQSILHSARKIYEAAGYRLVNEKPHQSWGGHNLVAETWELKLK